MSETKKPEDPGAVVRRIFLITVGGAALFAGTVFTVILPNW